MWKLAASLFQHLLSIERQEFFVPLGAPWKSVDAIKALDVIHAEQMKASSGSARPFAPPLKIVGAHGAPAIERNAPILPPFLRERVVLKVRLGWRATKPIEHEFNRSRENVGAVKTDAEGDVAHQSHAALLRMSFQVAPLLMC